MDHDFTKIFLGKKIAHVEETDNEILFVMSEIENGKAIAYKMYHHQDCCESVDIIDICGDLDDLVGSEILVAGERTNSEFASGPIEKTYYTSENFTPESCTWTFYELATINGGVTITWFGESNGYYSESVSVEKIEVDMDVLD